MSATSSAAEKSLAPPAMKATGAAARRWLRRDGFAILDQALFYGANFTMNILLARWLHATAYGAYAVALSVFFLTASLHTAVLTEPMMVYGARKYAHQFPQYVGLLLKFHWALAALAAGALALGAVIVGHAHAPEMALALWGIAAAAAFVLLAWFVRPACYVRGQAQWAALGSAVYALTIVSLLCLLQRQHMLSVLTAFLATGLAAMLGSIVTIAFLKPQWSATGADVVSPRGVLRDHWQYGSWNAIATVAQWSSSQILLVMTPLFLGLKAAAAISVVANLMRPLFPMIRSITPLMLPYVSAHFDQPEKAHELRRYLTGWFCACVGGSLVYGLGVTVFYEQIARHFFANKYHGYAELVLLFGLAYAASAAVQVMSVVIRAAGETRVIAVIWAIPGLMTVFLSVPVLLAGSLNGVAGVFALSYFIALAIALWKGLEALNSGPAAGGDLSAGPPLEQSS